ncbi:MAG: hypothetical protein SFU91_12365 [Chloroherpetonaceae bacterium]|nr:hypothetical protein [Chloroherpetonaceae bacterium]
MKVRFDSYEEANAYNEKAFEALLRIRASFFDNKLFKLTTNSIEDISNLTQSELCAFHEGKRVFPLLGYQNGKLNKYEGFTEYWDTVIEVDGKFEVNFFEE